MTLDIRLKRVCEAPDPSDGARLLVERLWPRGVSRERAALDAWLRDVAPSPGLRAWYAHDPGKWPEFQRRYRAELDDLGEPMDELLQHTEAGPVTFVYASREETRNSAALLRDYVRERLE